MPGVTQGPSVLSSPWTRTAGGGAGHSEETGGGEVRVGLPNTREAKPCSPGAPQEVLGKVTLRRRQEGFHESDGARRVGPAGGGKMAFGAVPDPHAVLQENPFRRMNAMVVAFLSVGGSKVVTRSWRQDGLVFEGGFPADTIPARGGKEFPEVAAVGSLDEGVVVHQIETSVKIDCRS